jgi:hypothetical protein
VQESPARAGGAFGRDSSLKSLPQGNQVGWKPTLHSSPNQQHFCVAASQRHIWEKRQFIPIQSQIYWLILLLD